MDIDQRRRDEVASRSKATIPASSIRDDIFQAELASDDTLKRVGEAFDDKDNDKHTPTP